MKHWIHYSILMLSLSMGACSSENAVEELHSNNEIKEIVANMGALQTEDNSSRTTVNMGEFESDIISLVWAEKDTIGIYPVTGDQLSFPITDGIGTNTCTFNGGGWALKTSTLYTAYSPFSRAYYYSDVTKLPVSMLGQKQVGNGSSAHIGKYDLQIAKGETPENGKITFDFEHQVCFIRMDLTAPVAGTWKSVTLKSDGEFTTEATMDLTQDVPVVIPTSTANSITLELDDVTTTDDNLTITAYMVVLPVDLSEKTLEVELLDSNGNVHYVEADVAHDYRNFKAGYARWIKAAYETDVNGVYKNGVASITNVGNLESILGEDYLDITSLKVVGPINGTDVACLRRMLGGNDFEETEWGKLTTLDLSEATIVEGGDAYYNIGGTYYTSNNQIGDYMFHKCANLQSMVLPDNATSIGQRAFQNCDAMISITIGNGISTINLYAFYDCDALNTIYMGDKVEVIYNYAFQYCDAIESVYINDLSAWCETSFCKGYIDNYYTNPLCNGAKLYLNNQELTELIIPEDVTRVREYSFYNCKSLVKVEIPEHVTSVASHAFEDCSSLQSVVVDNAGIGYKTFSNCSSLASVTIGDGVTSIGNFAFSDCSSLVSVTIGDGVTSIGSSAFSDCSSLASVTIGEGVTSIGSSAFHGCSSLTSVNIPDDVVSIDGAFSGCSSLTSINIPDGVTSIGSSTFSGCSSLTSINIPEGVTSIGHQAFWGCSSLTSINIPDGVTSIDGDAFSGCSSLKSVYITDLSAYCKISIGNPLASPFYYGAGLYLNNQEITKLIIPNDVTEIESWAFYNCSSIEEITIPDGIISIGGYTFNGCSSMTQCYCYANTPPTFKSSPFEGINDGAILYVPKGCVDSYSSSNWATYFSEIKEMEE